MTDDLTPEVLARWEELAANATEGAWKFWSEDLDYKGIESETTTGMTIVASAYGEHTPGWIDITKNDAEFIEVARTAVPALLSGVRSRDAQIAELEGVIARALAEADDWSKSPPGESAPTRAVGDLFADILRPGATNG